MTETNIGSNERRGSEMPTERGSTPRLSLDTLDSLVGCPPSVTPAMLDAGVKCDCAGCGYWKRTKADSVSVGALTLYRIKNKIRIDVDGGEGAEFDEKAVETALLEFYDNNF